MLVLRSTRSACAAAAAAGTTPQTTWLAAVVPFIGGRSLCRYGNRCSAISSSSSPLTLSGNRSHVPSPSLLRSLSKATDTTNPTIAWNARFPPLAGRLRGRCMATQQGPSYFPPMSTEVTREERREQQGEARYNRNRYNNTDQHYSFHRPNTETRAWSGKRRNDRAKSLRAFFSHRDAWVNFYDSLAASLSGETTAETPEQLERSFG